MQEKEKLKTAEQKKFYWLKLKKDFFKRHDIQIIESMPNGKDYVLFYLKLMCESIDHEGNLRFSDTIPYNEQMLSTITNTNIDAVRSALKLLQELNMIEILDDHTIYMNEVDKLIGSAVDNDNANRQRRFRERQKEQLLAERYESVTKNNESKSIDKDIDIEKEKEKYTTTATTTAPRYADDRDELKPVGREGIVMMTDRQYDDLYLRMGDTADDYIARLEHYIVENDANIHNHYATILKWHTEDTKVEVTQK